MIRELAENPNVHQAPAPGRELVRDPRGRFAVYLTPGTSARCATVQRVRLAAKDVEAALAEIRALLCARGREGAEWELGESSEPPDLVHRLLDLGLRRVQAEAFGSTHSPDDAERLAADFEREGHDGSTFVAVIGGRVVAAAYSAYTPWGVILFGGTLAAARGRGAYRSVVVARARDAARRGTPVLVTHAGRMSRPILERLGFTPVVRIDRLLDVLD